MPRRESSRLLPFATGLLVASVLYGGPPPPHSSGDKLLNLIRPFLPSRLKSGGTPVLHYFDVRGRGEVIRLALADIGVELNDASFTSAEWGKDRPDGLKAKWREEGLIPFGQVPLLELDGYRLVQTHAILRFLGRTYGWYLGAPDELAAIDVVADGTEDVRKRLSEIKYSVDLTEDEKRARLATYFADADAGAPRWLGYFERLARRSATKWIAGSPRPSHADYLLLDLLDYHEVMAPSPAAAAELLSVQRLPYLLQWRERMRGRPGLAEYLAGPKRRAA